MPRIARIVPVCAVLTCLLGSAAMVARSPAEEGQRAVSATGQDGPKLRFLDPDHWLLPQRDPELQTAAAAPVTKTPQEKSKGGRKPQEADKPAPGLKAATEAPDLKSTELPQPEEAPLLTKPETAPLLKQPETTSQSTAPETAAEPAQPDTAAEPAQESTQSKPPARPEPAPKPPLSPAMTALRDRVRSTLAAYYRQGLNTRDHTAGDILDLCLAYGCQTEVNHGGQKINGITCLCWNYPCAGYELLGISDDRIAARVGYGLQSHPSQFLAVLALSRVPADYPARVGKVVGTVADLVQYEKLSCRSGTDQSLKLVGLAYYLSGDDTWKNRLGEEWSLERLVNEEIAQPLAGAPCGGTYRLLGLSCALASRTRSKQPLEGQFLRAAKFLRQYQDYALKVQNADGSWHPLFFAAVGSTNDYAGQVRSTGHILQWLALSLPEDRLEEPRLVKSVDYLTSLLGSQQARWNVASSSSQNIEGVTHALHAVAIYDQRVFKPRDPAAPPLEAGKPGAKKAAL